MSEPIEAYRLLPGMLLARKYRLGRKIGQGAMGVVWAARNEATGREVALKVIARPDPSLRKRLLREAQSCGALQHPNIVNVIDVARTESGEPCLIMELLVGDSVAALLEARRRLEAPLAARIARDVAGALGAAHAVQIVHRDLKPANVFLHRPSEAGDFVVKVLDFGVAKSLAAASGATSTLDVVGSPLYMSPEQLRADEDLDARADLWSLGVMLFEMLTGVRPFQGEGPQLLSQILSGEIPKVSRYLRRVDERLVRIVDRCLRRERYERFGTAEEVARELAAFVVPAAAGVGELREGAGEAERGGLRITGERTALPLGSAVEQETVVAPARGQGSAASAEELATTAPLAGPGAPARESGGGNNAVVQGAPGQQRAHAPQGASAVMQGAPGQQRAHAPQGALAAGQVLQGAAPPGTSAAAPAAGAGPVVTLRGTLVMQGEAAEAQYQAAMARMRAAQAQQASARAAGARPAAQVGAAGKARRRGGKAPAIVAVTLVVGVIAGAVATTWLLGPGKPTPPAGADGGSEPAVGAAEAMPRERAPAAPAAMPAAAGPGQPAAMRRAAEGADAGIEGAAAIEQEQREGRAAQEASAAQTAPPSRAAPQQGEAPPAWPGPEGTADQVRPSAPTGTAGTATGAGKPSPGRASVFGKPVAASDSVYDSEPSPYPPPARAASPAGAAATAEKKPPPRPF
ncbi:protein kinase domain-containing protein [Sorangium sp. So ce542]|uniref:serine/threonine-protein kinase n=1 Tax=Sorangium sp. So ce542 TaxID=3133316 RepID=UPI003F5DDDC9